MRKFSPSFRTRWSLRSTKIGPLLIVALVFGSFGTALLFTSHAATSTASIETEAASVAAPAITVSDSTASSQSAIRFDIATSSGGSVTHGNQITTANTGYLAWVGPSGQRCTDANITVYNSTVNASSLGSSATCVYLKGGININAPITLTACRVDGVIDTRNSYHVNINYCTIVPSSPGDWSLGPGDFTATRSQIMGSSDGVRYGGDTSDTLIENYIRVKAQNSADHNDGIQAYGAIGGGTILRNNIDDRPVGGGGGMNGVIFIADGATGTYEIRNNYLLGGGYSLRLHENGYYRVTGNIVEKNSYVNGPINTDAARPGAFLEWSNNTLSDGTVLNP